MIICPTCLGMRTNPEAEDELCPTCKGREALLEIYNPCDKCKGEGKLPSGTACLTCDGRGYKWSTRALTSDPLEVKVSDIARMLGPLIDIQIGEHHVHEDDEDALDIKALALAGALVGYSQARSEQGYPPGWFLNQIVYEGGRLVLDAVGIWHQPVGSDYGVLIVRYPARTPGE